MPSVNKGRERTLQLVIMAMMVALIFIFSRFLERVTGYFYINSLHVAYFICLNGSVIQLGRKL